ncbi:alpha/beta-hydrolase [Mycena polygramma]|nr:alpha/beta-hydrolase [Mycena polygramma]
MMQAFTYAALFFGLLLSSSIAAPLLTSRAISSSTYDDLVRYTKYSAAAYQLFCPIPLGNTLVQSFATGDGHGFIARDDTRKEIVVSFRGSFSLEDVATDLDVFLTPFVSLGVHKPFNVHSGFLAAYNDVAEVILTTVKAQLAKFPKYNVVITGHSLGGALASLCASSLKPMLPGVAMKLYTFGQPRTGDAQFAAFVESTIGVNNIFRDGVPTMVPRIFGYEHHATEYWQFKDPGLFTSPPTTVKQCVGEEDPSCSDSIFSTGINPAHLFYFGQVMALDPLLCI